MLAGDGNIAVAAFTAAGALYGESTYWDMAVVALRPNGETLWVRAVPEPGWYEWAASVAVGGDSLVYLAGSTGEDDGEQFFTVACCSRSGRPLWTWRTRGDVPQGENEATCVATRQDGSAVVTGTVTGHGTDSDIFTALFAPGVGIAGPAAKPGPDRFRVPSHFRSSLVCRLPRLAGRRLLRSVRHSGGDPGAADGQG